MSKVDYKKDIVWHGKILRYFGATEKPRIMERTAKGGWKIYCHHESKNQIDIVWKRLWDDQDEGVEAVSTGNSMEIRKKDGPLAKNATGSLLSDVAEFINVRNERFKEVEKEATVLMLEMGLAIAKAKADLPHGKLQKWIQDNTTLNYRHATRFHQLAKIFVEAQQLKDGEAFALVNPANSKKALLKKLQQMAFDFLGDRTQGELFEEYGIRFRDPKKLGGDHGGGLARANRTPEEIEEGITNAIRENWQNRAATLSSEGLDEMTWGRLHLNEIKGLQALFSALADKMLKHINAKGK